MSARPIRPRSPNAGSSDPQPPTNQRRSVSKVSTACERCRSKRIRCDGERPTCRRYIDCNYERTDGRRNSPLRRELLQLRQERDTLREELDRTRSALGQSWSQASPDSYLGRQGSYEPFVDDRRHNSFLAYHSSRDPLASLRAMDFPTPGSSSSPPASSLSPNESRGSSAYDMRSQNMQQTPTMPDTSGINIRNPYVMATHLQTRGTTTQSRSDAEMGPAPSIGTDFASSRSSSSQPVSAGGSQSRDGQVPYDTGPENLRSIVHFNQSVLDAQAYKGSPVPIDGQFDTHVSILVAVYGWKEAQQKVDLDRRWLDFGRAVEDWLLPMSWASKIAIILLGRWTLKYYGDYGPFHLPAKPSLPTFLSPRPSQLALRHPPWVDYIPWPGFRERFTFEPARYCTNECFALYMANYRFNWQRPADDTIVKDTRTGLLRLTEEFVTALTSIDHHRMAAPFFEHYPELEGDARRADPADSNSLLPSMASIIGPYQTGSLGLSAGGRTAGRMHDEGQLRELIDAIRRGHPAEGSIALRRLNDEEIREATSERGPLDSVRPSHHGVRRGVERTRNEDANADGGEGG